MPVTLRPTEGGFAFVTEVYVHGLMQGEAWPDDVAELEEIVLV